ncbi:hypothetical protein CMK11_04790 [Candidatus Poribacteria bacterium]|nr:hypothetical protein [Candidatus Poribacteria bacterium]
MFTSLCWVSHPHEWQPLFRRWAAAYPERTTLHRWQQYGGSAVVGLTLGSAARWEEAAFRLLVTVPHAHEPAPTAAIVDLAAQLLTRTHLDGRPSTTVPRDLLLSRSLITFLPDTNSQGRGRSPERCWDGHGYDNDAFLKWAFGVAKDGSRFGRYPEWIEADHAPERAGIVYEEVEQGMYVEPNTSRRSTHSVAIDELFERYRYTHMLDMHQHEGDEAALLPADYEEADAAAQAEIDAWAKALIHAWRAAGAIPRPEAAIPYGGQPRHQLFLDFWDGRCAGMKRLVSEVRNNRHVRTGAHTPMQHQFTMAQAALSATLGIGLAGA